LTEERLDSQDEPKPGDDAEQVLSRNEHFPESEKLFSSILDQLSEAIVVCDSTGKIIRCSESARDLAGRDILLEPFDEVFPLAMTASADGCEDEQGRLFSISEVIGGLAVRSAETCFWRDEERLFLVVNAGSLSGDSNEIIGCTVTLTDVTRLAVGVDVTARRAAEEELKTYKFLSDSSAEGIVIMNNDDRCAYANRAYESMLGSVPGELLGKPLREMVLTDEEREVPREVDEALGEGRTWRGELQYKRKDGSTLPVLVSAAALRDERGTFVGRVVMVRDISELKENEEQLRRINESLDSYARTVSHDLRSPFSAILLSNEMLKDAAGEATEEQLREEALESAGVVQRNIEKSYALINDLLKLAEAGEEPAEVKDVDVTAVVRRILAEMQVHIAAKGMEVQVDDDLGVVRANETQIYQVFSNLISNALKHNDAERPAARIVFRGKDADGFYRYEVYDNGSGIPGEDLDRIFMPFYRQGKTAETGIGLSTVEKVVRLYGGEIRAFNREGPCFAFSIKDWE
jgi:two-component system, sensor histidine kinase and response regulator